MTRALVLLGLVGCAEPSLDDFDATCVVDGDCAVVVDEGYCGSCSSLGALSVAEADRFERRQASFEDVHVCRGIVLIGCFELDHEGTEAWCDHGTCALRSGVSR